MKPLGFLRIGRAVAAAKALAASRGLGLTCTLAALVPDGTRAQSAPINEIDTRAPREILTLPTI